MVVKQVFLDYSSTLWYECDSVNLQDTSKGRKLHVIKNDACIHTIDFKTEINRNFDVYVMENGQTVDKLTNYN